MHDPLRITIADGSFNAYVARPQKLPAPAIVVVHEVFGVNADMRQSCDELAAQGYLAICPDLFWRLSPGVDLSDRTEAERAQGLALYNAFDLDAGVNDIAATLQAARAMSEATGKVGVVGYCLATPLRGTAASPTTPTRRPWPTAGPRTSWPFICNNTESPVTSAATAFSSENPRTAFAGLHLMESTMLRLYDSRLSGNSWKIRILLSQLGLAYDRVTLDLQKGEARDPSFRQISRFARVPVLVLDDGSPIVESGAILLHLAQGTPYLPDDPYLRTEVMGWLFFEQADLQKAIAVSRVLHLHGLAQEKRQDIERLHAEGYAGLEKLDQWLRGRTWLVGTRYTIADLALSAYVSLADQGGYDMARFVGIRDWLARVHSQRGWVPLIPEAGS